MRGGVEAKKPLPDELFAEEVHRTVKDSIEEKVLLLFTTRVTLRSADDKFRLDIGGWVQPHYEYTTSTGDDDDSSSFFMRRVRVDIRGHVFTPALTFRIMPEFARTANLSDAWINYEDATG